MQAYDQDLFAALHKARDAVLDLYRPVLDAHDLTEPQWRALLTLDTVGPVDATRLAELAALQPSSLSRIIRAFEARRLVATNRNAEDGRRLLLRLTPTGKALLARAQPRMQDVDRQLATLFGGTEVTLLRQALDALHVVLSTQTPPARKLRRKAR
ncbi:MarR family transcriptional regulator [Citreimonas sp.]|uniref:MarR family transcriptional regulator n=1 Tax=Citreimonas sp. TaxID=3036715 RepID=UPI0035C78EFE